MVFSQESATDAHVIPTLFPEPSFQKRKRSSSSEVLESSSLDTVTPRRKENTRQATLPKPDSRKKLSSDPTANAAGRSTPGSVVPSRYLQLQARGTDKVFKMNEATLSKTSDLFKYKLYHATQPSTPSYPELSNNSQEEQPSPSTQLRDTLLPAIPISPTIPLVHLDTSPAALFLYCLSAVAPPDRLSLYLDSTIPRPSHAFTTYLYEAFLLALELKDATFLHRLIGVILKDAEAGRPGEREIAWVYANSEAGCVLREFVVDCTLTWVDEGVGEWRAWLEACPKEFVVDVCGRMAGVGLRVGWVKSSVATKYACGVWWPVECLVGVPEAGGEVRKRRTLASRKRS